MLTELLHNNLFGHRMETRTEKNFHTFKHDFQLVSTREANTEHRCRRRKRESGEFRKCECQDDCCLVLLGSEEVEDVIREGKTWAKWSKSDRMRTARADQIQRRGGHEHTMSSRCSKKPEKEISKCETQKKMKLTESLRRWVEEEHVEAQRRESVPIIHCFHADWACQRPDDLTSWCSPGDTTGRASIPAVSGSQRTHQTTRFHDSSWIWPPATSGKVRLTATPTKVKRQVTRPIPVDFPACTMTETRPNPQTVQSELHADWMLSDVMKGRL